MNTTMRRPLWLSVCMYALLGITSVIILYPIAFMVLATFTSTEQYYRTSFFPIPDSPTFRNYQAILNDCSQGCIWQSILITAARCCWYIFWSLLIAIMGGYAFGRLSFPFKTPLFLFF